MDRGASAVRRPQARRRGRRVAADLSLRERSDDAVVVTGVERPGAPCVGPQRRAANRGGQAAVRGVDPGERRAVGHVGRTPRRLRRRREPVDRGPTSSGTRRDRRARPADVARASTDRRSAAGPPQLAFRRGARRRHRRSCRLFRPGPAVVARLATRRHRELATRLGVSVSVAEAWATRLISADPVDRASVAGTPRASSK